MHNQAGDKNIVEGSCVLGEVSAIHIWTRTTRISFTVACAFPYSSGAVVQLYLSHVMHLYVVAI